MNKSIFLKGVKDGVPIGLGYFAVAFSLGIVARRAGLNAFEGFLASLLNVASAGENALFECILNKATYIEVAVVILVVNARYLLMSCALSQRFSSSTPFFHRFFVGYGVTDEIFGISIAQEGSLNPLYNYGAIAFAAPMWALGTAFGVIAGNILPARIVSALSVALYGMFIAIIVPPCKTNIVVAISVIVSFISSFLFSILPYLKNVGSGTKTIILTVLISAVCALIKPVKENTEQEQDSKKE